MKKPKPTIETLLMREACEELKAFSTLFEAWSKGHWHFPRPENAFHSLVKYTHAYEAYKLGGKGGPF